MAQKKVILKDGGNDLLPKTLASMVFTEAGQTVEEALRSAGGGGSSGGGTGNVKVTNASGLNKDNYYAFKPSANGSVEGTFSTIPTAYEDRNGLMSASNYRKLDSMKPVIALPVSVLEYNAETTSETIEAMLQTAFGTTAENAAGYFVYTAGTLQGEYDNNFEKFYIGDRECMLGGNAVTDGSSVSQATLEFSYVDGGKLHTVAITMVVSGESGSQTYTYSAKVLESGDDTYYLPSDILYLKSGATQAEIDTAFGGEGKFKEALTAGRNKKKTYIYDTSIGIIPVSSWSFAAVLGCISFMFDMTGNKGPQVISTNGSNVSVIYLKGYSLRPSLYSLATSSSSDDISAAVGGESGLKEIIQAVKDGNRLVIRGTAPDSISSVTDQLSADVSFASYKESENGDIILVYTLFGMTQGDAYFGASTYVISYTKSSNTFAIQKANIAQNI